jgi:hypothetical protein
MREAILILAYGDRARLEELVELEKNDYRDVLSQLDERCAGLQTAELIRRCRELGVPVPRPWRDALPETIEAEVKRFVAEELIIPFERIDVSMRLQEDLGALGAAGIRFMVAFGKRFNVDLCRFHPEAHFAKEKGIGLVSALLRVWGRSKPLLPVTVQDLVEAVRNKKFITPVGNAG